MKKTNSYSKSSSYTKDPSNYNFDTSTYIILNSNVRRESETGRFVEVNKNTPKKK